MQVTVEIPDDLAGRLIPEGQDPARALLEETAIKAFTSNRIDRAQLRAVLQFETRYELDSFLKLRAIEHTSYNAADLEHDINTVEALQRG